MATLTRANEGTIGSSGLGLEDRKLIPVKAWAALGVVFLVLQAYIYGAWITSGNATPTDPGPTPVPGWMETVAVVWQAAGLVAFAVTVYFFLVRPWRRTGRITTDGLFVLAFLTVYWQDPLLSYTQLWSSYNAALVNFGSWTSNVPGWMPPNGHLLPEPVLWVFPMYVYAIFVSSVICNAVMRKAKARWPRLGTTGLIMVAFAFYALLWLLAEPVMMRLGFYTYAGSISWLTINHGHYYQFPVYEAVFWGACCAGWACARYFRNDKGLTVAERGIDRVGLAGRRRTGLRFLALVGLLNTIFVVAYNIPIQMFALHASPWPEDIQNRSYLTNGLCGPGTTYACPGPRIPVNRPDSQHISPEGEVVPSPQHR